MSKRKRPKPNIVVLPNGERYRICVFQILSENKQGEPLDCKMIGPKDTVHLEGGEKFFLAYVNEVMLTT